MSNLTVAASSSFGDESLTANTRAILASVALWWADKASLVGLSGRWLDVRVSLAAQPPTGLPHLDPTPAVGASTTPEDLGLLYVSSLPGEERSKAGKHYTPSLLASRLWDMARQGLGFTRGRDQRLKGLVRDPACGAGALLVPPLREHLRAAAHDDPTLLLRSLPSLIQGVDTDPWSVWLTNVVLGAETLHVLAQIPEPRREPIPVLAQCGDGLALREDKALATIMNPPYGRLQLEAQARADFAHVLYGHANIYGMFIAAGADNTQLGGVMACLVPTSFTAGRYFHKLRGHLAATMPLHAMSFVEGRNGVFAGVLQETCLATFKHARSRKVEVTRSTGNVDQVAAVPVPITDGPWLLPREARDATIAAAAARMPLTLEKAGWHASTGPLVWNRRKVDLHSHKGKNRAVVLWGADVDGGVVHRDRARDSMRYLNLSVPSDQTVMVLDEPAVLIQRTTAPEQNRRVVCAELTQEALDQFDGRVVIENHLNVLRPTTTTPLLSLSTLARVLQTQTIDRLMRCISGSVAVSSYEIDSLPLPNAATLSSWEALFGDALETAVRAAYTPKAKRA
ncbi:Eco57I restriction-modification methylase domain-containing protein (plasmid) [Arthrobacter agilis]|uniref:Eco57I restriction-modification methylase domain-containing protein n=1 Tax=Arthrobacter agilis TaxID=37921 RepID=UPI002366F26E|nr:Eco57I restriction-modification methylase domain-containing protein [Arthrobacter agilis]WDF35202.1 Eco57I restriction-modification methylase domain-containing protein [Arthrobacter agilis]